MKKSRKSKINYNKWGMRFIMPFIIIYVLFSLVPLLSTSFIVSSNTILDMVA